VNGAPWRSRKDARERGTILDLATFTEWLLAPPVPQDEMWWPWIIQLSPQELKPFRDLCRKHHIRVIDTIDRQLEDLAEVRLPSSTSAERVRFITDWVDEKGRRDGLGNWLYLPWDAKVVHVLDRHAFTEVITNRNRDKITREEQEALRNRRVGVIGLSVGGEVAVALAQEHLCGEIVLADFDRLDLSNLNRLNAGVDDLGENKAVIVARRIARIDPYLKVTVFPEGITEANLDAFLDGLDLVIDECDALPLKYELRSRARARGLNVVFAGDERGFLSVEPYAQQPDLPLFHGSISGPHLPREAYAAREEFLRALTDWLGGWARISERSRRSLEQVGGALSGYPQLASEARYAAGQVGHVARRLLLGERVGPFIGHLDLDDLVPSDRDVGSEVASRHYLLFYDVVEGYVEQRAPLRAAHLEHAQRAYARGELQLAGALADPADEAVLVFRGRSAEVAESFARADPYVVNGLVTSWHVREWVTVVGHSCAYSERIDQRE